MTSKQSFYGWKLVAVLFVLDFLNMGFPFFGGAVINTYMLKQIPMARSTYGLGFSLLNLFIGLVSVVVAAAILKWNTRTSFAIGSVIICVGALWLSFFATKPWHYLVAYGIVIGTGISFSTIVPVTTVAARWFRRYRGRAMAIPLSASGFAGFVGAPLINRDSCSQRRKLASGMAGGSRNCDRGWHCRDFICEGAPRGPGATSGRHTRRPEPRADP